MSLIVLKIGGTEGVNPDAVLDDVAEHWKREPNLVLVHGGSAEATALGEQLGHPPRFIISPSGHTSRYTDRTTLEIFIMAVNGKINTLLVEGLRRRGVNAFGLCGLDGGLLQGTRKEAIQSVENGKRKIIRDDYSGKIESVNTSLLSWLLQNGYLPVVAPLATGQQGEALNVDADRAAAQIAVALRATQLILLTAAPGLLERFPDESSLIRELPFAQIARAQQAAQGRMKKKVLAAEEALSGGVPQVVIADGRIQAPLSAALEGKGTVMY